MSIQQQFDPKKWPFTSSHLSKWIFSSENYEKHIKQVYESNKKHINQSLDNFDEKSIPTLEEEMISLNYFGHQLLQLLKRKRFNFNVKVNYMNNIGNCTLYLFKVLF